MKLWNVNLSGNLNISHSHEVVKEEPKVDNRPGIPCFQCKGNIRFQHRGNRNPICCECKRKDADFTYCCMSCNLDVCDECAKKMTEKMMGMMNNMMGGMGMRCIQRLRKRRMIMG